MPKEVHSLWGRSPSGHSSHTCTCRCRWSLGGWRVLIGQCYRSMRVRWVLNQVLALGPYLPYLGLLLGSIRTSKKNRFFTSISMDSKRIFQVIAIIEVQTITRNLFPRFCKRNPTHMPLPLSDSDMTVVSTSCLFLPIMEFKCFFEFKKIWCKPLLVRT